MLMLMHVLGPNYVVWDKAASIDFEKPGRGLVRARFKVTDEMIADIRKQTEGGNKYLPRLSVDIVDVEGDLVARGTKPLYIRRKDAG